MLTNSMKLQLQADHRSGLPAAKWQKSGNWNLQALQYELTQHRITLRHNNNIPSDQSHSLSSRLRKFQNEICRFIASQHHRSEPYLIGTVVTELKRAIVLILLSVPSIRQCYITHHVASGDILLTS